jgi:hypothetical protein
MGYGFVGPMAGALKTLREEDQSVGGSPWRRLESGVRRLRHRDDGVFSVALTPQRYLARTIGRHFELFLPVGVRAESDGSGGLFDGISVADPHPISKPASPTEIRMSMDKTPGDKATNGESPIEAEASDLPN